MKKLVSWLKSPKSDYILFFMVIILVNLVGARAFFRIDTTQAKSFSLSDSSKLLVKTLEEPLSVKVFFSDNLPSPYNTNAQYLNDLLIEYAGKANKNFSWEQFDMDKPENQSIAHSYGINQIQIQEIKDNEVGFKNVWMGIAITYADRIEIIDNLVSADGLEYTLTTTMISMINAVSSLAGLEEAVSLQLFLSSELKDFNIQGFSEIESTVLHTHTSLNDKNMGKILYKVIDPKPEEIPLLVEKYGIQQLDWQNEDGSIGSGVIGMVLEYKDSFRNVPLRMVNQIFTGNTIVGLDTLEMSLSESLDSLMSKASVIGYVTGHGEMSIHDSQNGSGLLHSLVSTLYETKEVNLQDEDIPIGINTLVINGAKTAFSDQELYKIDQYVLRGGNLAIFTDPFDVVYDQMAAYGQQTPPQYVPINTGLKKLLSKYGIEVENSYVMDTACYSDQNPQYGTMNHYYIPMVHQDGMNQESPITANLSYVFFPQAAPIHISAQDNENIKTRVLASTSDEAWTQSENLMLSPFYVAPPSNPDEMQKQNLAVLVEGCFDSAFDAPPATEQEASSLSASDHIQLSIQEGKIFVVGSSLLTSSMVIDQAGTSPTAMFVMNVLDSLNGADDLARMRTRGISLNVLTNKDPLSMAFAKVFNQFIIPLMIIIIGFVVWRLRCNRRKLIFSAYNQQIDKD